MFATPVITLNPYEHHPMASNIRRAAVVALVLSVSACAGAGAPAALPLIPAPQQLVRGEGRFVLDEATAIAAEGSSAEALAHVAELWAVTTRAQTGLTLPVGASGAIRLSVDDAIPAEGYHLAVTREGISVSGGDPAGVFYGLQTLSQMLPVRPTGQSISVPAMVIEDAPRFPYRGTMLDVGRHFFGPDFVKGYIDQLARYKINRFHWHLTEDQGWRIQIDAYPRLTEVGSQRAETMVERNFDPYVGDGTPYGGFYTKDEIRDIVAYAEERFITIVPEIEMPGHSVAALAAYPEFACTEGPFEVSTVWGVKEDIYCPTEETFAFLETVLTEVMALFPGEYIHIGGDEAPKARWEESEIAQAVMAREGLADEHELQSWFIRRIESFLNDNGRRLIGWDEILEGGLAPNATVMSWRGMDGGIAAAQQGHDVVMTPTSHLYFDYYQGDPEQEPLAIGGFLPLERVYGFEPIPGALSTEESRHILGTQANVWTEYIATEAHAEYMTFPRLLALSEVAWSQPEVRSYPRFQAGLPWHLERFDVLGVEYRIPDVGGLERDRIVLRDEIEVDLIASSHGSIRYTLDGSEPGASSPLYVDPVKLRLRDGPSSLTARMVLPDGRLGPVRSATFTQAVPRPAALMDATTLEAGLWVEYMEGRFRNVARMQREDVLRREATDAVTMPEWTRDENLGLRFRGYLQVPEDAVYTLRLTSDDGSVLRMGNRVVIDHDGPHTASTREIDVALAAGVHPFELSYFQAGGGKAVSLEVEGPPSDRGAPSFMRLR
ncbi:MAG: family 20 glycosylhydrolase [Planctomycetota bacterium]|jgi:hexosaminidase